MAGHVATIQNGRRRAWEIPAPTVETRIDHGSLVITARGFADETHRHSFEIRLTRAGTAELLRLLQSELGPEAVDEGVRP